MKKYLPNAITSIRAAAATAAFVYALSHHLVAAFWLFLLAILTDFLDGLAAKKLNAHSKFGEEFDRYVDTLSALLGILALAIGGYYPWWIIIIVLCQGVIQAALHFSKWKPRTIFEVFGLFVAWVGIMWSFAYLAYGWSWLYVVLTFAILSVAGLLKKHRLSLWVKD